MDQNNYCKVLIISNNAFSLTKNNGKTLSSLFKGWPEEKIAQLYFYPEAPDFSICKNFFRITDEDVLFSRKGAIFYNKMIVEKDKDENRALVKRVSILRKYRDFTPLGFIRNILWFVRKPITKYSQEWVESFNPEAIFLVCGDSWFPYDIAAYISTSFRIPIYLFFTDDYITPLPSLDPFWWINYIALKISLKKILSQVDKIFVIGEEMALEYGDRFNKKCITVMNSIEIDKYAPFISDNPDTKHSLSALSFAYFGGLHLKRWETLEAFGKAIKIVSKEIPIPISISIYSSTTPEKAIMDRICDLPYIRFVGSVNEKEIIREMFEYNVLVHVESFSKKTQHKTRLSISTKIPEYLATGKPLLAIGPKEIASMQYLESNQAAYLVYEDKPEVLREVLLEIYHNLMDKVEINIKNINLVKKNHSFVINRKAIKDSLAGL